MSDKLYPNLARLNLKNFDRDLNYTGIPLQGWAHPVSLIPFVLTPLILIFVGRPKSFTALWVLFNIVIIHPMDLLVGSLGIGPKYIVDEYAILDTRYWVLGDPCVTIVSVLEFFVMIPFCFLWYRSLANKSWNAPLYAVITCTWQIAGTIFYLGEECYHNFEHMPASDFVWPPKFDTYLKLKYFWFIGVTLNGVWIVLPSILILKAFRDLKTIIKKSAKSHFD